MKYTVNLIIALENEHNDGFLRSEACAALAKCGTRINLGDITSFVLNKKSIDARRGKVKLNLRYDVYTGGDVPEDVLSGTAFKPMWKQAQGNHRVIIVGDGPAGIFAALMLLEHGIMPVIVERGSDAQQRKRDIADISRNGAVNDYSNYCFGEGGAGTFSDGKLYSRSNKRGNIGRILSIFHYHGADSRILTDAHPHIGSDKLPDIVRAMNDTIRSCGGGVYFNTCCTALITEQRCGRTVVTGITTENTVTHECAEFRGDAVIMAAGHSAVDVYEMIASVAPRSLEAKTFAAGVRVEHPRALIDGIQYRRGCEGRGSKSGLPAAEYRLTAQIDNRGVYSFCMCPGGLVVPSSSCGGSIVINGMSPSDRNGQWSNAAIVTEIRPEDIPSDFTDECGVCPPLAGLHFRTSLEKAAFQAVRSADKTSNPQAAPAQLVTDFISGRISQKLPRSSYVPGLVPIRIDQMLPPFIAVRLGKAFTEFNARMRGFISPEALVIAPETRTSTPVRILRLPDTRETPDIQNLYPAGEGSGYAGGIVSSAMDGESAAAAIIKKIETNQ